MSLILGLLDISDTLSWHDKAYLLLSSVSDWHTFTDHLERLHGGIHIYVGGPTSPNNGHMTFLWYSAFDPIFWLHHAQVDRLVALWQAIHPYTYIDPGTSTVTTYYVPAGTIQDENSTLAPFHKNEEGEFYTGQSVRRLKTFGYSYPELVYWSKTGSNVWSLQKEAISIVNGLYNPKYTMGNSTLNGSTTADRKLAPAKASALGADWEWSFELKIDQAKIENSMALVFYHSSHSLASEMKDNRLIIGPKIFLSPKMDKMVASPFSSNSASVSLTQTLLSLGSLEPDVVLPWIKGNIIWRCSGLPTYHIAKTDAESSNENASDGQIPKSAVYVALVARRVTQSSNISSFPSYGPWIEYANASLIGGGGRIDPSI